MRGWAPDGREVDLTGRQQAEVEALLADPGDAWQTVLHTAVRLDGIRRGLAPDDPVWDALGGPGLPAY